MIRVFNFQWYLVAFAVAAYLVKLYRDYNRLRSFKGPWASGWTSIWLVRAVAGLQTHIELAAVCEKYGKYIATPACLMRYPTLPLVLVVLDKSARAIMTDSIPTGSVARIGPNTLVTSSPELIFRMSAARSLYTKGYWYAGLRLPPGQDNLFSQMDEKKHTHRKAQMADGVSHTLYHSAHSGLLTHPPIVLWQDKSVPRKYDRHPRPQPR